MRKMEEPVRTDKVAFGRQDDGGGYTLNRLVDIALELTAEKDFDALMQKILLEAMEIYKCDAGTVYVKDGDFLNFHTVYTKSKGIPADEQSRNANLPPVPLVRTHVCACSAIDKKKINIPDIYESKEYDFRGAQKYDAINNYRTGSMLVIPMCDEKDDIIGVLQLINALDDEGNIIPFASEYEHLISALASLAAVSLNNRKLAQEVIDLLHSFVKVMVDAIEARSSYNATHTRSMVKYAERFIRWLDDTGNEWRVPDERKDALLMSVWLHDIGKLVVPLETLDKPDRLASKRDAIKSRVEIGSLMLRIRGLKHPDEADKCQEEEEELKKAWELIESSNKAGFLSDETIEELIKCAKLGCMDAEGNVHSLLTDDELEAITVRKGTLTVGERHQIEKHVVYTGRMLSQMKFKGMYADVPFWAASHHELLNGSGYPDGLVAKDLPNEVRLLTIIDVYDALTAEDRPYKPPMPPEKAFAILDSMCDEGKIDGKLLGLFKESRAWEKK